METLSDINIEEVVSHLPSINLNGRIEWDISEGKFIEKGYEVEAGDYFLRLDLDVTINGYTERGDYWTPSEFVETRRSIDVSVKELWNGGELVDITFLEMDQLEKAIEKNITT